MSKVTTRTRRKYLPKVAHVRESRVVFFGNENDMELQESMRKAAIAGRKVEIEPRPSFDSGLGPCGKHQCSCKTACKAEYEFTGAYHGDHGATMGQSY